MSRVYSLIVVHKFLIEVAFLVVEHGFQGAPASAAVARGFGSCSSQASEHRLDSCGARAYLLLGMRDLLRRGMEPVSAELAGGFFTAEPPEKPWCIFSI